MTITQDEARRRNALLSTGPKTQEGKERTRLNALKHGLRAKTTKETEMDSRDNSYFKESLQALTEHYKPQNPVERMFVQRIALLTWRLERVAQAEQAAIHPPSGAEYSLPPAGALERILRYERTMNRQLHSTINQLEQLRRKSQS